MAKKSPKSSRRARAKKEQAPKKTTTRKEQIVPEEPVIIAEGSDEPVVKATPKKKSATRKPKTVKEESAPQPEMPIADSAVTEQAIDDMVQPARSRMLVSAFALGIIVIALIFGANILRQQNEQKAAESVQPTQSSAAADDILQSGGKMCTNEQATSDANGSSNPQSVGMMLQSNPTSSLQTPQTFGGGGSDAAALQGAACF